MSVTPKKMSPWIDVLGKVVLYAVIPVGVVIVVWKVLEKFIMGPADVFTKLYEKQLKEFIKKMEGYAAEDNGVLNEAQQESIRVEEESMNTTLGNLASALQQIQIIVATIGTILAVALALYVAAPIYTKWKKVWSQTHVPATGTGADYVCMCALAEQMALEGKPIMATNFMTSIQSYYHSIDMPAMQATISSLQSQINAGLLTGFALIYAQYMISSFTYEMTMIPSIFGLVVIP